MPKAASFNRRAQRETSNHDYSEFLFAIAA
jgi:hypothetical protein